MGEYRVKSSRSALADRINSTELPELNVLSNRKSDGGAKLSTSAAHDQKFSLADEDPTEVGSTDDLLAAVGGIDGWDSISDPLGSGGNMSESDFLSTLDSYSSELFNDIDKMDTDKTQALPAPDFKNLPNIKSSGDLPMPKSGSAASAKANRQAILNEDIDIPSLRSSKAQGAAASIKKPAPTIKPAGIKMPAKSTSSSAGIQSSGSIPSISPKSASTPKPSAPDVASIKAEVPDTVSKPAAAEIVTPSVEVSTPAAPEPEVAAPPMSESEVSAAITPESEVSAASTPEVPPVSKPEIKEPVSAPAPKASAPVVAPTEPEPVAEMSAEDELQAMLASMSPTERAEYEAYCRAQERQQIEEARMRQQRLMENYGTSQMAPKKAPVGLIIAIIIILGLIGGGLYFLLSYEPEQAPVETAVSAEAEQAVAPLKAEPLETYKVNIETVDVDRLYINGVLKSGSGSYDFVKGHRNTILAFSSGYVPYFKTFEAKETVTETIKVSLEPDILYAKGRLSFRLTDPALAGLGLKVELDGVPLSDFPDAQPTVVLGRPHLLTVEKEGFGKHMHLIWPDDTTNTVTIPQLVPDSVAKAGTSCNIKAFPKSTKPYGLLIEFDNQKFSSPVVANVLPGGMIEYHITREQRKPLQFALIPEGYGTVSLDTSLMHDSIGESVVLFKNVSNHKDLQLCMRRSGEVICPPMETATEVPSGTEWEFFAIRGTVETPQVLKGAQTQELKSRTKYIFDATLNARGTLDIKMSGRDRIKKDADK